MIDARIGIIEERLKPIKRIIAVSSGKGGVGKSVVSTAISIALSKKYNVGLLDLDFYGPSTHIILNASGFPEEKNGLIPPEVGKIKFMSIIYFTADKSAPLKGKDIINAIIELLMITIWGNLDFLVIDMPPGMGEEVMAIMKFMEKAEFAVVTTPSILSWETVKKLLSFLKSNGCKIDGVVENMIMKKSIKEEVEKNGFTYLGGIHFDESIEKYIGKPDEIMNSNFGKEIEGIARKIEKRGWKENSVF